jgi:hypothetical protein
MSLGYIWEKFYATVSCLASGSSPIQDRIANCYTDQLIRLTSEDFDGLPNEFLDDFREITQQFNRVEPSGDEGSALATARAMSDYEASQLGERIVGMYDKITRMYGATKEGQF